MRDQNLDFEGEATQIVPELSTYLKCLRIGTPKTIDFQFLPNGKLMLLDVPIFKHIRVLFIAVVNMII